MNNISKVATLATLNTNELLALINLRDALHFLKYLRASDLDDVVKEIVEKGVLE